MAIHYPEENEPVLNGSGGHLNRTDTAWPILDADGVPLLYKAHPTISGAGVRLVDKHADHAPFTDDFSSNDGKWSMTPQGAAIGTGQMVIHWYADSAYNGSALRTFHHTDDWSVPATPDVGTIWRLSADFKPDFDPAWGHFATMPIGIMLVQYGDYEVGPETMNQFPVYFNFESDNFGSPPPVPPTELPDQIARLWEPDTLMGTDIDTGTLTTNLVDGNQYEQKLELELLSVTSGPTYNFEARGYLDGTLFASGNPSWSFLPPTVCGWHGVFEFPYHGDPDTEGQQTFFDNWDFDII